MRLGSRLGGLRVPLPTRGVRCPVRSSPYKAERQSALAPPVRFPCEQGRDRQGGAGTWRMAPPRVRRANQSMRIKPHQSNMHASNKPSVTPAVGVETSLSAENAETAGAADLSLGSHERLCATRSGVLRPKRSMLRHSRFETCVLEMHTESWIPGQVTAGSQIRS